MHSLYRKVVSGMVVGFFSSSCFAVQGADVGTDVGSAVILSLGTLALIIGRTKNKFRQDWSVWFDAINAKGDLQVTFSVYGGCCEITRLYAEFALPVPSPWLWNAQCVVCTQPCSFLAVFITLIQDCGRTLHILSVKIGVRVVGEGFLLKQ